MNSRLMELEERLQRRRRFGHIPIRKLRDRSNPMEVLDEMEFRVRFHMSKETTVFVYELVKKGLERPFKRGTQINPMLQLLIAFRYYATGTFQLVVGDLYNVTQPTVCRIVKRISLLIAQHSRSFIKLPNFIEAVDVRRKFYEMAGFPG